MSIEIVRKLNDYGKRLLSLEAAEKRATFGRDVLGPVDYIHFQDDAIPTGYAWAGSPFSTPTTIDWSYKADYGLFVHATNGNFLYRNVTTFLGKALWARVDTQHDSSIGIRIDDGTDNNLEMMYISMANNPQRNITVLSRLAGVSVTQTPGHIDAGTPVIFKISITNPSGSNHFEEFSVVNENGLQSNVAYAAANRTWTVARVGLTINQGNRGGYAQCDWLYTTCS